MAVIPTDTHVELSYGLTGVDVGSYALTGLGLLGLVGLARHPRRHDDDELWLDGPEPAPRPDEHDDELDGELDEELDEAFDDALEEELDDDRHDPDEPDG
jgi:MYXO-CTERM domain-containing protein